MGKIIAGIIGAAIGIYIGEKFFSGDSKVVEDVAEAVSQEA